MENSPLPDPGKRLTIAFLTPQILDTNGMELWLGVATAARQHDVNLICFVGNELRVPIGFRAQANVIYDLVSAENIDGLVIWGSGLSNYVGLEALIHFYKRFRPLPLVNVALFLPGIHSVLIDSYQEMHKAIVHLIEIHQYTRIAFIRGPEDNPEANERYRAYTDALREHNIPFEPTLVVSAGRWQKSFGAKALQPLLIQSDIQFQAVAAACDGLAIGAMESLQARGFRVPGDVAVIGFDNVIDGRYTTPPLTSVPVQYYQQGYRAVEMLLALVAGESVSEHVVIAGDLVVRQSCGCIDSTVTQAAMGRVVVTGESLHTAAATGQEQFLRDLAQAITSSPAESVRAWGTRVFDAFVAEMQGLAEGAFVSTLDEVLCQVNANGGNVGDWQSVITILRRHTLPYLGQADELVRADNLWQQAQVLLGQMMQRTQAHQALLAEQYAQVLRELEAALITTFDLNTLMRVLAEGLPRLGVPGCYLALYEDAQRMTEYARCMLAYNEQGSIEVQSDDGRFPARQLVPHGLLSQKKPYHLVLEPLYFQDNQIGFVLFEPGPYDGKIYEILRGQISSALQGALLVQHVQQHSAELARKQYILDTFMANVPDAIYFKDRDSCIIQTNQAHASRFGFNDPVNMIGKTDFDLFPEEQARLKYEVEQEIIRTGQPALNLEEPGAGGGWSLTTKMPLRDEHDAIIGTFGISRDITALKQIQSELEQTNQALQESLNILKLTQKQLVQSEKMAALGELVAGIAHEINTPLGVGVTAASHLEAQTRVFEQYFQQNEITRADLENYLHIARETSEIILRNLQRASDHIKSFKQVAVDQTHEEKRRFKIKPYLDDVLTSLHPKIKHTLHHVTVMCPPDLEIYSYPGVFSQIISNFVLNSLVHGLEDVPNGEIQIEFTEQNRQLWLRYQDNGKGMDQKTKERIFDPFFTTRRGQGGTGLGLYIVYNLVTQKLHGQITCESSPNNGTVFLVRIPIESI